MYNVEEIKKKIEDFEIQDLADIVRKQPLISGENSVLGYNIKQRKELKSCMLDIVKRTLDLTELEYKFLKDNHNKIFVMNEDDLAELKELIKKYL